MKATRVFQLTALALVVVAAVQVGWWLFDQRSYARERVQESRTLHAQEIAAARHMLAAGTPAGEVATLFPDLELAAGEVRIAPARARALDEEVTRRMHQYLWEGGFFLLALFACITVIARALREEVNVIREQENFLALVSHQFKTPLASLQLSLETMAMRPLTAEQSRTLIERMLADLARMAAMVSQILESVRLERGRVELRREPIDLAAAVTRVLSQYEERARREKIDLQADVARGLYVLGDPLATDVIVRNLIENALAAVTAVGGGRVRCEARRVGAEVELTVRDSGVGFRPADGARLFKKFTRLHPAGGSRYYGTGLGLFIVRRLMQLGGGSVTAHSDGIGQGARFVLTWPATSAEAP